jgi:hypothetical protein
MTWTLVTNLELNWRGGIPVGPPQTEFVEKPDNLRPEIIFKGGGSHGAWA